MRICRLAKPLSPPASMCRDPAIAGEDALAIQRLIDAIEQDRDPAITGEEALATQSVIDAILDSGKRA